VKFSISTFEFPFTTAAFMMDNDFIVYLYA
jgi:hypothetical protein